MTDNFGSLTVSPISGPAGGLTTLNGVGFPTSSSLNISYLNPVTSAWIPLIDNLTTASTQNFTYTFNAPDLQQNNQPGDNQPRCDNIVFKAQDNSNGNSYNTLIPYTEWRRGLTQLGNTTADGLYGNNTNLATNTFVQNNQAIIISGNWFSPGTASLLWDNTTDLGTATIDETGFFNATILVPTTSAGQHTITINDGDSNFCVSLTRLPTLSNDYDGLWHTTNFTINLTPDYNISETYYSINNGPVSNVTANGQPIITTEGSNNTLEYWGTWDIYGTGTMELPHILLTGIELDKTPPQGSIQINNGETSTSSSTINLTVNANDSVSGISQMRFSNDGIWDHTTWEPYINTINWQLTDGDGAKTVYCQIQDNADIITTLSNSIILDTTQTMSSLSSLTTSNPSTTPSPTDTLRPSATPSPSPSPSKSLSPELPEATQVPELSIQIILVLLVLSTILFAVYCKRKANINRKHSSAYIAC
ncbi:MAG: hypothetical protein ABSA75_03955 [Candidatus Bathyarchaeia archaeon]